MTDEDPTTIGKQVVWENFATGASGDIEIEQAFLRAFGKMYATFCAKQRDYGRGNIAAAGEAGVATRANDKLARLRHLLSNGWAPANEPIADSWLDVANYGAIGMIVHAGEWGTTEVVPSVIGAGWKCPDCRRCYAPSVLQCPVCGIAPTMTGHLSAPLDACLHGVTRTTTAGTVCANCGKLWSPKL